MGRQPQAPPLHRCEQQSVDDEQLAPLERQVPPVVPVVPPLPVPEPLPPLLTGDAHSPLEAEHTPEQHSEPMLHGALAW